ncbi:pentapeptide repeat-containing protein [bacterium SCSIO 12844]|nr:pentapeptide repeat-containing protein [bacterium SCSIO 12844]
MKFIVNELLKNVRQETENRKKDIESIQREVKRLSGLLEQRINQSVKNELILNDSIIKSSSKENENLENELTTLNENIGNIKNRIIELFDYAEANPQALDNDVQIKSFITLREALENIFIAENNNKINHLVKFAEEYQSISQSIADLEESRKSIIGKIEDLEKEKNNLLPNLKYYSVLNEIINKTKADYRKHLINKDHMSEENADKLISEKFAAWNRVDWSKSDINDLSKALFAIYHEIKKRESFFRMSDSRKILLRYLGQIGIQESFFKYENMLKDGIKNNILKSNIIDDAQLNKSLNDKLNHYLDINSLEGLLNEIQNKKATLEKNQANFKQDNSDAINQINALNIDSLNNEITNHGKNIKLIKQASDGIDKNLKIIEEQKNKINSNPNEYINEKINYFQKKKGLKQKEIAKNIREYFKQYDIKNIIDNSKDYLYQNYIQSLTNLQSDDSHYLNKSILNHFKSVLESKNNEINQQIEFINKLLSNINKGDDDQVIESYEKLNIALDNINKLKDEVESNISKFIHFLLINSNEKIKVPNDFIIDFKNCDLRLVNLNQMIYENNEPYDFSKANFNGATFGSVSVEELKRKINQFKEALDLDVVQSSTIISKLKNKDKDKVISAWNKHFSFYPIDLNNDLYLSTIEQYLLKIENNNASGVWFETVFPLKLDGCDLSKAKFVGNISDVSLSSIQIPKDLKGVEIDKSCQLENANFNDVIVDENTKLPLFVNYKLENIINQASEESHFSLENHIFNGGKDAGLPKNLKRVNLNGAQISDCVFENGEIDRTTVLEGITFVNVRFKNLDCNNAVFKKCTFENCTFESSNDKQIKNSTFESCNFNNTKFSQDFVSCNFIDSKFEENTFIKDCSFKSIEFNDIRFDRLDIDENVTLTDIEINEPFQLKELKGDSQQANNLFVMRNNGNRINKNPDSSIKNLFMRSSQSSLSSLSLSIQQLSADQFLQGLQNALQKFVKDNKVINSEDMRKEALQWIKENVSKLSTLDDCVEVQAKLQQEWKNKEGGKSNQNDVKWRLFNSFSKTFKTTDQSHEGEQILNLIKIEIRKKATELELKKYNNNQQNQKNELQACYGFLHKAFRLFEQNTYENISNLNLNGNEKTIIKNIYENRKIIDIHQLAKDKRGRKNELRSLDSVSEIKTFVNDLKDVDVKFGSIFRYFDALFCSDSSKVNSFVDSLDYEDLVYLSAILESDYTNELKDIKSNMEQLSKNIINILFSTVNQVIERGKLSQNELEQFLLMIKETPFTKEQFLDASKIEDLLLGKKVSLFKGTLVNPNDQIIFVNQLMAIFNKSFYFESINGLKSFDKIRNEFLNCLADQAKLENNKQFVIDVGNPPNIKIGENNQLAKLIDNTTVQLKGKVITDLKSKVMKSNSSTNSPLIVYGAEITPNAQLLSTQNPNPHLS